MRVETKPDFNVKLLHPKYWVTWLSIFFYFLLSLLPIVVLDWIGERLGGLYAKTNKKRYGFVTTNLSLCFPNKTDVEIDEMCLAHFRSFMRSMMHYGKLWWSPRFRLQQFIIREGFEELEDLRQNNQNIIAFTCHTAGLEFVGTALSLLYDCSGPYKPMKNPVMDWVITKGRARFGIKVFTRDDGLRPLIRYTREGHIAIYLADEDLGAERTIFAPFFGVQKATIPVLGRLAKSCDAKVLPTYSYYDKTRRKYIIKLLPSIENFPVGDNEKDVVTMNKTIEQMIMLCPEQYMWTLRYFKTRPEGEPPVY